MKQPRRSEAAEQLTPADLLVLAMLAEKPTHGYDLVAALDRRDAGDNASVSRAQIYYSLKKLQRLGLIEAAEDDGQPAAGPEREPYRLAAAGRRAMSTALSRPEWARQRPPIPFHTWLALVGQGEPADRSAVLNARRAFLDEEIDKESRALAALRADPDPAKAVTVALIAHTIEVYRLERQLLEAVEGMLRTPAPQP